MAVSIIAVAAAVVLIAGLVLAVKHIIKTSGSTDTSGTGGGPLPPKNDPNIKPE